MPTDREFVTDQLCFHPYGVEVARLTRPNSVAFRWAGAVQRIHRIIHADVVPTFRNQFPKRPEDGHQRPTARRV